MRKLKVLKDFTYFHGGHARKDYAKGEEVETEDDEMADVATRPARSLAQPAATKRAPSSSGTVRMSPAS